MIIIKSHDIKVIRREKAIVVRGKAKIAEIKSLTITGSLQPEKNITLMREIFGAKVVGALKVYTTELLKTFDKDGDSDFIIHDGKQYEVSEIRKYDKHIPHYKVIAILKKDEQ